MGSLRFGAIVLSLSGLVAGLSGCGCEESNVVIDDFQACVDGCGWRSDQGRTLETVRTFHSVELGLLIPPHTSATRGEGISGEEFHLVSNCPDGLALRLEQRGGVRDLNFRLSATSSERDNAWYRLAVVMSVKGQSFDTVSVINTTGEPCIIDQVRVLDTPACD